MNKKVKIALLFTLKFIGTAIFLYWAFHQVEDKNALAKNFKIALTSPFWLTAGILLAGVSLLLSTLRLHTLLKTQSIDFSFLYLYKITLISYIFTIASFGTAAGDAYKMICIMRHYPQKKVVTTMTIAVDHLIGFISASIIFLSAAWIFKTVDISTNPTVKKALLAATAFQLIGMIFIIIMFLIASDKALAYCRPKAKKFFSNPHIHSITTSINIFYYRPKSLFIATTTSVVLSACYYLAFGAALGTLNQPAPASTILTVMPIVDTVSSLPISFSGLGIREKTFEFLLSDLTNISPGTTISASLIGYLFNAFWALIGAILLLTTKPKNTPEIN